MHIPDLHEFMRAPWSRDSGRAIDFDWEGQSFWLCMKASEFVFKKETLDSHVWGAIFTEQPLNSGASPDEMRAHFAEGWRHNRVGRLLALPNPSTPHQSVLVGVNDHRFWLMNEQEHGTETSHSARLRGDLWEISEDKLRSWLMSDWNNANSFPRRAWKWDRLDFSEKVWSQLTWTSGSRQQLENLTRAMAHSDTEFWHEHDWWATNYQVFADGKSKVHSLRGRMLYTTKPSARIARLGQLFLDHNRATLQRPPLMPALTPARSFSPEGYAFLHLPFSAPSQHEKLEAHMLLRDWLKDKISSTEIELLVPRI